MKDNTVEIDRTVVPSRLNFARKFNVAVPFIDAHVNQGRGHKAAIKTADKTWSYQDLFNHVNSVGNHLLAEGIKPGERLMMVVRDCPEFIALFFVAIKVGIIPAPVNTLLRKEDYTYLVSDSSCAGFIYSSTN